jgi:radical SAM protein with 4Fe4S-binding SPASM domain
MPVWNRATIIEKSINSVLKQSYSNFELIIVDDGSEDDLEKIVYPYLSRNIYYYKLPHRGVSAARNFGIRNARGDFIAYLDSDNIWHPDFLLSMHSAFSKSDFTKKAAYCKCNVYERDEETGNFRINATVGKEFDFKKLLIKNYIDMNTFVHAKECIEHDGFFDERLTRCVDWDFVLRITEKYAPLFIPHVHVDYYMGIASNAISLNENVKHNHFLIRGKFMKTENIIRLMHDAIWYRWENVPDTKYANWLKASDEQINSNDYTAHGFPYMLQIEPTNTCNLSCPLCPVSGNRLGRKSQHLSMADFKSIIDDMESYLLFLILWDWGEPFMNQELPHMIQYASDRDIKTVTSTNAHFLSNSAYVEEILKSGLTTLIVAIDSLHEENYTAYRKKGDLGKALDGLRNLLKLKKKLKSKTFVNLRMVIMKYNEHELGDMRNLAKRLKVDYFTVKTVNPSCGASSMDQEILPNNPAFRRYEYIKDTYERVRINTHCTRIWRMSNIFSNGDVVPCCYDYNCEMKVGSIHEKPLSEIWHSSAYRDLRKNIYYNKDSIPKCRDCGVNFKLSKNGWFVESHHFNTKLLWRCVDKAKHLRKRYKSFFPVDASGQS